MTRRRHPNLAAGTAALEGQLAVLFAGLFAGLVAGCAGAPPAPIVPEPAATAPAAPQARDQDRTTNEVVTKLGNGLALSLTRSLPGAQAQLQLGVFAGSLFVAPGLAELAAQMLVESSDASRGRPSLEQAIANLGGTLEWEVGPLTTWIAVRVPDYRWQEAQAALHAALAAPPLSRSQIERIRDQLVAARGAAIRVDPTRGMARALLLGEVSTASYVNSLLDRDAGEISLFQARLYRPDRAILAMQVPAAPPQVLEALGKENSIASWSLPAAVLGPISYLERGFQRGVYWAPDEPTASGETRDACRVAMVLFLPDLAQLGAAELLVMHACVTLDGAGGRFEQMQRERGLEQVRWRSEVVQTADAFAVVLSTTTTAANAAELWHTLQRARTSLSEVAPNQSELELARRRAALTARLGQVGAISLQRNRTRMVLRGASMDTVERRLSEIEKPSAWDLSAAAKAYLELPVAMVAIGGQVPPGFEEVRRFQVLPTAFMAPTAMPDQVTQAAAATPWLQPATEAAGGPELLRQFGGFEAEGRLSTDRAPAATDQLLWRLDGTVERTRELLGAKIETKLQPASWTEQLDDEKQVLNSREADLLRREMERHPLALLAAHVRGDLTFRPIAQRNVGDRDLMVLEALGDRFDRLRVHIDTNSHLVRVVEVWETMPDGTVVHLEEAWSDYRSTRGLRAPFRRITTQDDTQNRVEMVYTRWVPLAARQ